MKEMTKAKGGSSKQVDFSMIVKKAYERGLTENEMTLEKILAELKSDLKNIIS
ncbi:hypothetical protein [Neobacillus sp. DY30]|uniref:hypothetical protein n=1 Tax=Neobacillus sp. DY30 TaxID=3047871 RepID=UPI0024C0BF68|nr:hypothetical protein [Neobacillus sp. DY30]WHY00432.1 hypothetical protein QNH29_28580 [Neobacillus sp. DY30]